MSQAMSLDAEHVGELAVSAVHGPAWYGQAPAFGQMATSIVLSGCNLRCRFCDVPWTWDPAEPTSVDAVLAEVDAQGAPLAVVTGGEPLLQQHEPGWGQLLAGLRARGKTVFVETNGTVWPTRETVLQASRLVVSPKLANASLPAEERIVPDILRALAAVEGTVFTFICRRPHDVDEVAALAADLAIPAAQVWIVPEGQHPRVLTEVTARLLGRVDQYRFNLSPRLIMITARPHVLPGYFRSSIS
ncbi:7-carboxy-7-deazaguanine synthase QueE [Microbispora sp. NPDC049125]|uniref:7-carboxy-7-deazaguanine synthase QueE n=1 Tax=Microbispora sp. NPDC049125 TaxID=3154929 RepID=UPI003465C889